MDFFINALKIFPKQQKLNILENANISDLPILTRYWPLKSPSAPILFTYYYHIAFFQQYIKNMTTICHMQLNIQFSISTALPSAPYTSSYMQIIYFWEHAAAQQVHWRRSYRQDIFFFSQDFSLAQPCICLFVFISQNLRVYTQVECQVGNK